MGKEKFIYNTQTLRYEKVEITLRERFFRIAGFTSAVIFSGVILMMLGWKYFPSPNEQAKNREINRMVEELKLAQSYIENQEDVLAEIQERDRNIHRMILGMDPIDEGVWNGGVGGHERYKDLRSYSKGDLMASVRQKAEQLKWRLAQQSKSLDDIAEELKNEEKRRASIPSIKPVRSDKLKRNINLLSGYGYRIHPIHKVRKMHYGIDFTSPRGTGIQATGDGKVVRVEKRKTGYGHNVIIDHGYHYKTLYGHMSRIDVKVGEQVKKGQLIGLVGSTGSSTAPHLHYEVHYKGNKVNPIDYCQDGLTPEEYQDLVERAETANQAFDNHNHAYEDN